MTYHAITLAMQRTLEGLPKEIQPRVRPLVEQACSDLHEILSGDDALDAATSYADAVLELSAALREIIAEAIDGESGTQTADVGQRQIEAGTACDVCATATLTDGSVWHFRGTCFKCGRTK